MRDMEAIAFLKSSGQFHLKTRRQNFRKTPYEMLFLVIPFSSQGLEEEKEMLRSPQQVPSKLQEECGKVGMLS